MARVREKPVFPHRLTCGWGQKGHSADADLFCEYISSLPKEVKASLGKACQIVQLTGKLNFPYSRHAGVLAAQDRGKRFHQRFLKFWRFRPIGLGNGATAKG